MARWSAAVTTLTSAAIADTTNLTTQTFLAIQGGSATQLLNVLEVSVTGQATASAMNIMLFARDTTVFSGATSNAGRNSALSPFTAALAAPPLVQTVGSSTLPQRSVTNTLLNISLNFFGGIYRWVAAPGEEIGIYSATQPLGEASLSAFTGSTAGAFGAHIIYEPF